MKTLSKRVYGGGHLALQICVCSLHSANTPVNSCWSGEMGLSLTGHLHLEPLVIPDPPVPYTSKKVSCCDVLLP